MFHLLALRIEQSRERAINFYFDFAF